MTPPRFRCLNSARQLSKKTPNLRAGFSTSRVTRAEDDFPSADDLSAIGNPAPARPNLHNAFPRTEPTKYQNVPLPQRQTAFQRAKPNNPEATARLLSMSQKYIDRNKREQAALRETGAAPGTPHVQDVQDHVLAGNLTKMITRRWKAGDVYAPHDLHPVEYEKWRRRERPSYDAFDVLDMNPLDHYRNFSIMSEYMTPMGRIMHSKETGLRPVNQRRIAKAIRRTIGMGLMPSVHRHPEILQKMISRQQASSSRFAGAPY